MRGRRSLRPIGKPISPPRLIWSSPVVDLARQLREEAKTVRAIIGAEFREAGLLERIADRIEKAAAQGARDEYVFISDAAAILGVCDETIRRRCQREYEPAGLAQKRGGTWYVHVDALTGKPERANDRRPT